MSVTSQNQTANEEEVYFNFINSLKSDVTKITYEREIKKFMNFCGIEKLSDLLILVEPQKQIIKYLMSQREKETNYQKQSKISQCLTRATCGGWPFFFMS